MSQTTILLPPELKNHCVLFKEGRLNYDQHGSRSSTVAELDAVFAAFEASGKTKLVLDFHGGLVDEAVARSSAADIIAHYTKPNAFPLFVQWDSDFASVFERNWLDFVLDVGHHAIINRITKFVTGGGGNKWGKLDGALGPLAEHTATVAAPLQDADAIARIGDTEALAAFEKDLKQEFEASAAGVGLDALVHGVVAGPADSSSAAKAASRSISAAMLRATRLPRTTLDQPEFETEGGLGKFNFLPGAPGFALAAARWVVEVALAVKARWDDRRWHGFHATLVEEIAYKAGLFGYNLHDLGKFTWGEMKQDIRRSFGPTPEHGASAILRHLRTRLERDQQAGRKTDVLLLGHSAGSIYICEFLKEARTELAGHDLRFDVVFFAPAVTFKTFTEVWDAASDLVDELRIFTMYDQKEREDVLCKDKIRDWMRAHKVTAPDWLVDAAEGIYPHSLLYLISGVLEDEKDKALVGMERFHLDTQPAAACTEPDVQKGLQHINKRVVWSITTGKDPGFNSGAVSHGGFPSNPVTRESTEHIILNGLP